MFSFLWRFSSPSALQQRPPRSLDESGITENPFSGKRDLMRAKTHHTSNAHSFHTRAKDWAKQINLNLRDTIEVSQALATRQLSIVGLKFN
jgi:hypothetical protein